MTCYLIISYLVMFGAWIQANQGSCPWYVPVLAPLTCPIFLGICMAHYLDSKVFR
jgi:hypothetical protein